MCVCVCVGELHRVKEEDLPLKGKPDGPDENIGSASLTTPSKELEFNLLLIHGRRQPLGATAENRRARSKKQ